MAKTPKRATPKQIAEAGPQDVPMLHLRFLDAALTRPDFRQALFDVSGQAVASPQGTTMKQALIAAGICAQADVTLQNKLMNQIVLVNWKEVYSMEKSLGRAADTLVIEDLLHILDA